MGKNSVIDKGAAAQSMRDKLQAAAAEAGAAPPPTVSSMSRNPVVASQGSPAARPSNPVVASPRQQQVPPPPVQEPQAPDPEPEPEVVAGVSQRAKDMRSRLEAMKKDHGTLPVRFNHDTHELSFEEAQRYAQIGMAVQNLEERKKQMIQDEQGYRQFQNFRSYLQENPAVARQMEAVLNGQAPNQGQNVAANQQPNPAAYQQPFDMNEEVEPQVASALTTLQNQMQQMQAMIDTRLSRAEQAAQSASTEVTSQRINAQLEGAISRDPFLSDLESDDEARQFAKDYAMSLMSNDGGYTTPETAVSAASARLRRLSEAKAEREMSRREEMSRQHPTFPASQGIPDVSGLFNKSPAGKHVPGSNAFRSESKRFFKEMLRGATSSAANG